MPSNRQADSAQSVLVVDDEPTVREVIASYLSRDGLEVVEAVDGRSALAELERRRFNMLVLDLMLPDISGLEVLRQARQSSDVPVIVLTGRCDEPDRVLGLELGADDYMSKPFSPRELSARVRSVLRRVGNIEAAAIVDPSSATADRSNGIAFGELHVDPRSREVRLNDSLVELTSKEFDLLWHFAQQPRRVFSRQQLLELVWDSSAAYQDPATVTVHIGRLRQKLEIRPDQPRWISTVWGIGYRFDP